MRISGANPPEIFKIIFSFSLPGASRWLPEPRLAAFALSGSGHTQSQSGSAEKNVLRSYRDYFSRDERPGLLLCGDVLCKQGLWREEMVDLR